MDSKNLLLCLPASGGAANSFLRKEKGLAEIFSLSPELFAE